MKFSEFISKHHSLNENWKNKDITESSKPYYLLYHLNTQRNGKEEHNYYVWAVDDLKSFSDYARGTTIYKCLETLDDHFALKETSFDKIELLGKVNGVNSPVSTENADRPNRTKEKAIQVLKKLCPKAIQVLNASEEKKSSQSKIKLPQNVEELKKLIEKSDLQALKQVEIKMREEYREILRKYRDIPSFMPDNLKDKVGEQNKMLSLLINYFKTGQY